MEYVDQNQSFKHCITLICFIDLKFLSRRELFFIACRLPLSGSMYAVVHHAQT